MAGFTPINLSLFLISQAFFIELFKKPLGPLVIIFLTGSYFSIPIIGKPQGHLLALHIFNIGKGPIFRRYTMFNSSVFCRHTKGVPTHWVQDIKALHLFKTSHYVTNGIVTNVTHVEVTGWIREHFKYIVLFLILVQISFECLISKPLLLPFLFNILGVIFFLHALAS